MADNVTGIVLDIPTSVLSNIKSANEAIQRLEKTSRQAANNIKSDFDRTMVSGVEAFMRKVQEAQNKLGGLRMPTIDGSGLSAAVQALAQAMGTIDRSATTGSNRLGRIADAMTKLQTVNPNPILFQNIADGITKIGSTSQQTIDNVRNLSQTMAQLARDIRTVQTAQSAQASNTATAAQYNKLFKEQSDLVRRINEMKAKGADADVRDLTLLDKMRERYDEIDQQLDKLNRKKQSAASELARTQGYNRVGDAQARTDAAGAINYVQRAKSLNELQAAYKNLKAVMATADPKSKEWEQMNNQLKTTRTHIQQIEKKMGAFKSATNSTNVSAGQLAQTLASVFSISAIRGYINKMIQVRAQFELQQTALRAILQNKDEADRIFMQVQQVALQSPFSIMQITTFTKQLAAYRVETEKLVGTTKMLADVSAGLGVDMSRLILAYGQVKSANYLRATEIRQFTEAGLNIAGELAQYFSELQGKMVSVGDVMEMVTKRMVRFEDVEEVFKRVTSAGGLFYDMQKKQSETLWGLLQRIKDSMSIMFNEIGKSNQSTINTILTYIRELLQKWRELVPLVTAFGAAIAARIITKGLLGALSMCKQIYTTLKGIVSLQALWNSLSKANVWGAILGVLVSVVAYIMTAKNETSALADELDRIRTESANDLKESIADFHQLAKTASDVTKSYTERKEALEALNRTYKDILPSYMLEAEWLEKQVGNYDAAIAKIREYFQAKEMEKQIDTILSSDYYTEAVKQMQKLGEDMLLAGIFDATVTKKYTNQWMSLIASEIATGKIENSATAVSQRLSEIFGKPITISDAQWKKSSEYFKEIDSEINNITAGTIAANNQTELFSQTLEKMSTKQLQDSIDAARKKMGVLQDSIVEQQQRLNNSKVKTPLQQQNLAKAEEKYAQLAAAVAQYEQALANAYASDFSKKAEEQSNELQKQIKAVSSLAIKYDTLARTNTGTKEEKEQLDALNKELSIAKDRTIKTATALGIDLTEAELTNIDNLFDLQRLLDDVAQRSFSALAKKSVEDVGKGETAIKGLIDKVDLLKRAINSFSSGLGFGTIFDDVPTEEDTKSEEEEQRLEELKKAERERNEEYIKGAAERAGIDAKLLTQQNKFIKGNDQSAADYAKNLREQAKAWKEQKANVDSMSETQREFYLENNRLSMDVIELHAKEAEALEDIANAYDPLAEKAKSNSRSSSSKDPWIEIFTQRTKAVQDFYKQYETLREKFSTEESQRRDVASFMDYFKATGIDMNKVISQGWDTKALVNNLEEIEREIKAHFGSIYKEAKNIMKRGISIEAAVNPTAEQKMSHALAKLLNDLQKQIADNKIKLDFEIQDEKKKDIRRQIDEMFDNYNLTKELTNLGLDANLTLMVGGNPMSLEYIRAELARLRKETNGDDSAKDLIKVYEEAEKKITDIENKAAIARLKNYHKYFLKSASERVRIELESQNEINKIRSSEELDTWSKSTAIDNIKKDTQKKLDELSLKEFRASDVYIRVFADIENASRKSLEYVAQKLNDLKTTLSELSVEEARQLVNDISKVDEQLGTLGGFSSWGKTMRDAYEFIQKRNQLEQEYTETLTQADALRPQVEAQELIVKQTQQQLDATDKLSQEGIYLTGLLAIQKNKYEELKRLYDQLIVLAKQLGIGIDKGNEKEKKAKTIWRDIALILSEVSNTIGDIGEGLENMGLGSKGLTDTISSAQEILGGVIQTGSGVATALFDPNPINKATGAMQALGSATKLVGALFSIGDKKKERQIQRLQEKIEDLEKAYEKLGAAIEDAYSYDDYNMAYNQSMQNLEQQRQAIQEQMALEESKKKSDKDKIQEYKDELDDLIEKEKELREERYEAMGSVSNSGILSEAENWASAWLDAYKETGDGLDALSEQWDEFLENLVLKQAASAVVSKRMQKYVDRINAAIDSGDTGLSLSQTFAQIGQDLKSELGGWNEDLKAFFDAVGISGGTGSLLLSDLQKGIQNITESQAAAIEAYLNSMRFAVFEQNSILTTMLSVIQAQYGTSTDNPVLTEVKAIRSLVASIDNRLSHVIVSRNTATTSYIMKVS